MDLTNFLPPCQQRKELEIQVPRAPATPAKPVPTRPHLLSGNGQGELKSGSNWGGPGHVLDGHHHAPLYRGHACHNGSSSSRHFLAQLQDLNTNSGAAVLAPASQVHSLNAGSLLPLPFSHSMGGWAHMPCSNLLEFTDTAAARKMAAPFVVTHIGNSHEAAVPPNQLLLNGKVLLSPANLSHDNNRQLPMSQHQYGFPIPFLPNLNSLPENTSTGDSDAMPCPSTPVSQDNKGKRPVDDLAHEVIDLVEATVTDCIINARETVISQNVVEQERDICSSKSMAVPSEEVLSNPQTSQLHPVLPSEGSSVQPIDTEQGRKESQGIDLNKEPQQKPKRRKHRPKVIREGKPNRTPKPKTPKPVTPKPATNIGPTGKRKYVQKKSLNSVDTPSSSVKDIVERADGSSMKSVRRSLNFDSEGFQVRDKSLGSVYASNVDSAESQDQGACVVGTTTSSSTKSNMQLMHGVEVLLEDSTEAIAFDLNQSVSQIPNRYISFSQKPAKNHQSSRTKITGINQLSDGYAGIHEISTPPPHPSRRELIRENLNNLARKNGSMKIVGDLDGSPSDDLVTGSKRGHNLIDDASAPTRMKFMNAYIETNQVSECHDVRHDPCLTDTCKKRRTEDQIEFTSNASSVTSSSMPCAPSKSCNAHHMVPNNSTTFTFTDTSLLAQEKLHASEAMLSFVQIERVRKNRFTESVQVHNPTSTGDTVICNQLSTPEKPYENSDTNCNKPAWGTPSGSDDQQENDTNAVPARVETAVADSNEKVKPKARRKKGQAQVVSSTSSDANIICMQENGALSINGSSVEHKSVQTTAKGARKPRKKNPDILHMRSIQDCQSSSSFPESLSLAVTPCGVLIEAIIQKLKHLNINKVHEDVIADVQNALVLYGGGVNTMVPYEGPLDLVKKRRPRVKVDLDPETQRKWKLLMEKGKPDADDVIDEDKEKWWEEERRVFHGRANSFIARMHLVQGDRRFSQWKGSVVDSVVGVFLTQNVSDHLSSSAFMALAARFPAQSQGTRKEADADKMVVSVSQQDESILPLGDNIKLQEKIPGRQFSDGGSTLIHEAENITGKQMADSSSLQCSNAGSMVDYLEGRDINLSSRELEIVGESPNSASHESSDTGTDAPVTVTGITSYAETEDRRSPDDVISSQNSAVSSQNSSEYPIQTACWVGSALEAGGETDLIIESMFNGMESSTSFTKLLEMANERILSRQYSCRINQLAYAEHEKTISDLHQLDYSKGACPSVFMSNNFHHAQDNFMGQPCIPSTSYHLHNSLHYGLVETQSDDVRERGLLNLFSSTSVLSKTNNIETTVRALNSSAENTTEAAGPQKFPSSSRTTPVTNLHAFISKQPLNPPNCSQTEICTEMNSLHRDNISRVRTEASQGENMSHICMQLPDGYTGNFLQNERKTDSQVEITPHAVEVHAQMSGCRIHQKLSKSHSNLVQASEVTEPAENPKPEVYDSHKVATETESNKQRGKKIRAETGKNTSDWDNLRRQACSDSTRKERSSDAMDSVDWKAVRQADVHEISNTIRERGMNNMLAERIKDFLNRLVMDHGSIDLEWLRDVPPDKAKDYLLSIRGLGIKSVECVRLLTLQHLAFPVDTNVGRICVRLGWVPLQPLPESLQLHLLELYPVLETIQKYLWPRLCTLDQRTLYELHYQMITFGKVFCTKSKPNCNACPMRGECKHFASAFASARLALPGPEEKQLVSSTIPTTSDGGSNVIPNPMPLAQLEGSINSEKERVHDICEPIIEEPATPEPECIETSESAIEDAFFEDPDEIPTINLNFDAFTQNLQNYMQANNMEMQDGDMSRALVLLSPEAASIPMPKLKNVSRLRTEHQVYELPDSHPLLEGFDQREPDDPCSYLLSIWTPGETAQSTEPPKICCNSQEIGRLCNQQTCFACSSKREGESQTVRGTLLIPCRTAMRGSFPLNGTYFQVNEVFADHDSSHNPINVPREWIWDLPRRTVYFGTSIPTIFKGLSTEGIQHCFWRGFVCVRGFDRTTRAPKPLYARLHFPASKATRNKRTAANDE